MKTYIAIDGDGVGKKLGEMVKGHFPDQLISHFAMGVAQEMRDFADQAIKLGATVLLCSGDSALITVDAGCTSQVLANLKACKLCTYSAGTGRNAAEAALFLQYAKTNGKAQTWHWQKGRPFWLWLRIESPFRVLSKYAAGHL